MKLPIFLLLSLGLTVPLAVATHKLGAQPIAIKSWHGKYPRMNETYPLSFIAFKGFLIPVPHVFVRMWPTHYYLKIGALPVSDAPEYTGKTKTGFLRIAAKLVERSQMQGRYHETGQIKSHTQLQKAIEEKLFDARSDKLPDIYRLADRFIHLYAKINRLDQLDNTAAIKEILKEQADQLLMRFLMVNFLQSDHGEKLNAFSQVQTELNELMGETDYTFRKVYYFNFFKEDYPGSYAFLSH